MAEVAEAESAVRTGEQELTGWLRVAASVGYGRLRIMQLVQSFLPGAAEPVGSVRTVRVQGNFQTNSSEVIRASVLAGMGIAFSPDWLFE